MGLAILLQTPWRPAPATPSGSGTCWTLWGLCNTCRHPSGSSPTAGTPPTAYCAAGRHPGSCSSKETHSTCTAIVRYMVFTLQQDYVCCFYVSHTKKLTCMDTFIFMTWIWGILTQFIAHYAFYLMETMEKRTVR